MPKFADFVPWKAVINVERFRNEVEILLKNNNGTKPNSKVIVQDTKKLDSLGVP